ncbi:hypothetical protein CFOL_v3_14317 [Cephalotus follicularis]|uniref:Putative plant transposon protein domain-containing protein n=1 Tax=Cephalotus follicularis TaxID=3775 RepID=A0A1Q3BSG6_CEPFO|nr:hypothetical protein CFOL_v3_14317 [Cephalotus follicularis]
MASKRRKSVASKHPRPSQGVSDYNADLFLSKENETRYHSVLNSVKLHNEKWIARDILVSNFVVVKSWLEQMGWLEYLCSSHTIYPRLVKIFYANLENSTTCVANSFILGNQILGIPNSGITHFNDIVKSEDINICLERTNFNPIMTVTGSHLPIATRILLLLVTNTLLPREGSHTLSSERDLKFVACIKNGTLVNLPYLVINHMLSRS